MKRIMMTVIICLLVGLTINTKVASAGVPSLDDIVTSTDKKKTDSKDTVDVQGNNKSVMDAFSDAGDLSEYNPQAESVGKTLDNIAGLIVQILSYVIVVGLVVRVFLDLCYITLPFTRGILANGYMGNHSSAGQGQQGMGMGGTGMGGGYGNRYGGMNGMGGMGGMQNQMGMQTAMNNQPKMDRIQFISNAALNAVASENMIGPDGGANSPFKIYAKDMIVVLVITPILITLALTGVLNKVGFAFGNLIATGIRNMMGKL